jgi:hypothetical protein
LQWISPLSVVAGAAPFAIVKSNRLDLMTIIECVFLAFFAWARATVWLRDRRDQARVPMEANHDNENDTKGNHSE